MKEIFPKKYDFNKQEKHWLAFWKKNKIYRFDNQSSRPIYSVDTPPPYVSAAHLHAGHIMSYSQAEFVVRYKRMKGFNIFYPMGFDDNGLPTERFVEKKYNLDKSKISRSDFIKLCLKETKTGAQNYRDLWTSLGISVDWTKIYSTINALCQKVSQWSFIDLFRKGKVYRQEEPVLWCPFCQSALAQADLEDETVNSSLNYISFSVDNKKYPIATTRPELIPACVAIFANPQDQRYFSLKNKKAAIPLFDYSVPVYFSPEVDPKFGTGLVMVCTWGDFEDIKKFKEFKLPIREVLNQAGEFNDLGGRLKGLGITAARKKILDDLLKENLLVRQEKIKHVINTHERCGTPVEFVLAKQWFIKVLESKKELLEKGKKLNWYPGHMRHRYESWIKGLKWDWCISRQRYYGVPFPVWYCQDCGEVIPALEKDLPLNPAEVKPPVSNCPNCRSVRFIPEKDVMDTWATSSCSPFIIPELVKNKKIRAKIFPNSLRPQAFEIIRTWLFYTIVKAHHHFNKLPFKDVMISGHGLDEKGKKISKRLGNYIKPSILLKEYGADAIRYWATGATLGSSHRFNLKEVEKGKYLVTKLFNASRFCANYLSGFKSRPEDNYRLEPEDDWILHELNQTVKEVTLAFEKYEYAKARNDLDKLFWATFCDYYLEMIKHRADEASVRYVLYRCLLTILKLYAPILPFITEEIYQRLFRENEKKISLHLADWPRPNENWQLAPKDLKEIGYFISEIDGIRKEKVARKLRFKELLTGYTPRTKVNLTLFGKKLQEMLAVEFGEAE
ncbi:MAG: valine--tRNA ligase [Candidatus Pacebacteria bacterium]|nr:valine--tRNA ligase [Candidatus Paceibacterota bacterium]